MQTSILEQDGNMVAFLEGRLDAVAAQETEKAMQPLCECEGKDIIIDCTHLEYISSAGLRIFLRILQNAQGKGQQVFIKNINDTVRAVFAMTGFINIFKLI